MPEATRKFPAIMAGVRSIVEHLRARERVVRRRLWSVISHRVFLFHAHVVQQNSRRAIA
jgi:hypothetical protein